ncbi:MAG: hypothetical protein HQ536_02610, partial [Parcubacteria group bacterium]|nr:hypothetical protein [Parcubacteria group bacterium]
MNEKTKKTLKWVGLTVVSFAILSFLGGVQLAILLMAMIGLHEGGHILAAKSIGVRTAGFWFIPLFGGAALIDLNQPESWKKYVIAYGGPLVGLILCLIALGVWAIGWYDLFKLDIDIRTHMVVISTFAIRLWSFINVFNLLPIYPLDGGRLIAALCLRRPTPSSTSKKIILIISWCTAILLTLFFLYAGSWFVIIFIVVFARHIGKLEPGYVVSPPFQWHQSVLAWLAYVALFLSFF